MGLFETIGRALSTETRNDPSDERWWDPIAGFTADTYTGKSVTPDNAVEGTIAVYAAVALLAETIGSLPLHTFRKTDEGREKVSPARNGPGRLARMLHEAPNPEMSAQEYWENVEGHKLLWGNHYSYIRRDGAGNPVELWPLRPDMMEVNRRRTANGMPVGPRNYVYTLPSGEKRGLGRSEVLHVTDFSTDGIQGLSRIEVARNAIGIEQAAGEYAGRFFSNSARPDGVLQAPHYVDEESTKRIKTDWENSHRGLGKSNRIAVLHSGLSWQSIGMPPKDAQFIEVRRFQIGEIARLYRIPPHMIGDLERSTSWGTGIEQQSIGFVVYTLRPLLKRIEGALVRDLGDPDTGTTLLDGGRFAEFQVEGLLRGDMAARSSFYSSAINDGWMTPNDARSLENLPPLPGMDRPRIQSGFVLIDENGETVPLTEPSSNDPFGLSRSERIRSAYAQHMHELTNGGPS
jgi:HK97 family phage portal protein